MKKHFTFIVLLMVFAFSLTLLSGCAEKKSIVKDEAVQEQKVSAAQEGAPEPLTPRTMMQPAEQKKEADREAALKAQAERDAEAKRAAAAQTAAALTDLNIQNIYFDYDKYNIREDAREILKANAEVFTKKGGQGIVVEGYCDERGTAEYNMALGERRAQEAKQYLLNLGIGASRIETISYGEERPLDTRSTDEAWAKNRRAQFLLK